MFDAQPREGALQCQAVEAVFRRAAVAAQLLFGALFGLRRTALVDVFRPFHRLVSSGRTSMKPSLMNASREAPSAVMRSVPGSVANTMG